MAVEATVLKVPFRKKRKIFTNAPAGTCVFRMVSGGRTITHDVAGIPLPLWPDGGWCIELAGYMHKLAIQRLSLADRGGTPGTYASQLSHLVRYCYSNKVNFHEITNEQFEDFIDSLSRPKRANGEPSRNTRTICGIGRRSLEFLDYVGGRRHILNFIGPDGSNIVAERKTIEHSGAEGGAKITRYYWHHCCFPTPSRVTRRYPVPEEYINRLQKAIFEAKSSSFLRSRRRTLLRVLEATGARRIEVVNLTVADIWAAKAMEKPYLNLLTFKRKGEPEERMLPISHSDLDYIIEHIEVYRAPLVADKMGDVDHGILFVSERTGASLTPNTVTLEVHLLRKAAGIEGKAHPHLFRHRYITMAIFRLIRAYKINDRDHFAEMLLKVNTFVQEVMERTGHKSMTALSRYVDWAFALSSKLEADFNQVELSELARTGRSSVAELEAMRGTMTAQELAEEAMKRMKGLVTDMSRVDGRKTQPSTGSSMLAKAVKKTG
ncbi:site-specific integrase [Burkholderia glumae]|uniref:site-specific integrase n=1 Tax=Burkholderia glumae TaxID=337 RepID=UPI002150CFD3|nr:site-specific integrase [Burkholderia glumae]CAJ3382069.1 site-specific tyrosine recombinase XerD [Burkholderia pseudomallei]